MTRLIENDTDRKIRIQPRLQQHLSLLPADHSQKAGEGFVLGPKSNYHGLLRGSGFTEDVSDILVTVNSGHFSIYLVNVLCLTPFSFIKSKTKENQIVCLLATFQHEFEGTVR